MSLATLGYAVTENFPRSEQFGLTLQMRKAAVSVASNIAEGAARRSSKEFGQFLSISLGPLAELDMQLELAIALGWLKNSEQNSEQLSAKRARVAQLTTKLRQAILKRSRNGSPITDHGSTS